MIARKKLEAQEQYVEDTGNELANAIDNETGSGFSAMVCAY